MTAVCWAFKVCTVNDARAECLHATEAMKAGRRIQFGDFAVQVSQSVGTECACVNYTRNTDRPKVRT